MSAPTSEFRFATFNLDGAQLGQAAVKTVRIGLGLSGAFALVIGILLTFWTKESALALSWLIGFSFVLTGIAHLVLAAMMKGVSTGARILDLVLAALQLVAGVFVLANAAESAVVFGIFLGIWIGVMWIIEGITALVQSGDAPSRIWAIVFGAISIIAGITLLFSPLWGALFLFWFSGISLIALGIAQLIRAFSFGKGVAA